MAREHTVPLPGGKCAAFQPASLFDQPGHIPGPIFLWDTHDWDFDAQGWDFKDDIGFVIFQFFWLCPKRGLDTWRKTSDGDQEGSASGAD